MLSEVRTSDCARRAACRLRMHQQLLLPKAGASCDDAQRQSHAWQQSSGPGSWGFCRASAAVARRRACCAARDRLPDAARRAAASQAAADATATSLGACCSPRGPTSIQVGGGRCGLRRVNEGCRAVLNLREIVIGSRPLRSARRTFAPLHLQIADLHREPTNPL